MALVFNRHSFHALGCGFVWDRFSLLVDRRTPFVVVAILMHLFAGFVALHHSRELGKEKSETKSSTKWKASGKTAKVSNRLPRPLIPGSTFPISSGVDAGYHSPSVVARKQPRSCSRATTSRLRCRDTSIQIRLIENVADLRRPMRNGVAGRALEGFPGFLHGLLTRVM